MNHYNSYYDSYYYSHKMNEFDTFLMKGRRNAVMGKVKIGGNQGFIKYSVVGINTKSGEVHLVDKTKTDGTQMPYGIITETIYSQEPCMVDVYIRGDFISSWLTVAPNSSIEDFKEEMKGIGLVLIEDNELVAPMWWEED